MVSKEFQVRGKTSESFREAAKKLKRHGTVDRSPGSDISQTVPTAENVNLVGDLC